MNKWMNKLSEYAGKSERTVLGLMSGTSMDGIDIALCEIRNSGLNTEFQLKNFESVPVRESLCRKFQKLAWKPESPAGEVLSFEAALTAEWVRKVQQCLRNWDLKPGEIDLIASHGQTILHQPDPENGNHTTLQIVDGDRLAAGTGIVTISDFRQKHITAGFEGAPLAPLGELLLFAHEQENRILLNLGGIANFTVLTAGTGKAEVPFATDCGPANTLLDETVKRLVPGQPFDVDGAIARQGQVSEKLLEQFLSHSFFKRETPKSTGQEEFNWKWVEGIIRPVLSQLKTADLLATLTELTAITVSRAIWENTGEMEEFVVYVSGGGWNNAFLMERIRYHLSGAEVKPSTVLGTDPDAKEAILFAVMANELIAGEGWVTQDGRRFTLGKISIP